MNTSFLDCTHRKTHTCECVSAIYYDSYYDVAKTCVSALRLLMPVNALSRCFTYYTVCNIYLSFIPCPWKFCPLLSISISSFFLFPPFFSALGSKTQFQSVDPHLKSIAISTGLDIKYMPVRSDMRVSVCMCVLCSAGFMLQFQSNIINRTPRRAIVKHVRWYFVSHLHFLCGMSFDVLDINKKKKRASVFKNIFVLLGDIYTNKLHK